MKPFTQLTHLGQVRRLRRLAEAALVDYGPSDAQLRFIAHGENATFRVDASDTEAGKAERDVYTKNRFLLRIHRPGYQSAESVAAELMWLAALRQDIGLAVPEPVLTLQDELLTEAAIPGIPERRVCSLLRWMTGRFHKRHPSPRHFAALGRLMARLHNHAEHWQSPTGFARRQWDWGGLFDDETGSNLSATKALARLPRPYHDTFHAAAHQLRQVMDELGQGPDAFGLIHADLHFGNVLFSGGEARAIDFDDCGLGYWAYDFAVPLCDCLKYENWRDLREALLDGYAQIRPVPVQQLRHVDAFMAARHTSIALWVTDRAHDNSFFRARRDRWLKWLVDQVRQVLDGFRVLS